MRVVLMIEPMMRRANERQDVPNWLRTFAAVAPQRLDSDKMQVVILLRMSYHLMRQFSAYVRMSAAVCRGGALSRRPKCR